MFFLCPFLEETDITDQSSLQHLLELNRPLDAEDGAEALESIKAKVNAIRRKLLKEVLSFKTIVILLGQGFMGEGTKAELKQSTQLNNSIIQCLTSYSSFFLWFPFLYSCLHSNQGPCHIELHAALDIIAESQQMLGERFTTFYLPNCDKHGFYKAKQVSCLIYPYPLTLIRSSFGLYTHDLWGFQRSLATK